ncbi:sulfotransferase family protein [Pontibaca salina]|uniref:Sulfotransferase domain-containing protein n=1 Tax=Pontibaca salina TaxID=2795731 RepID=A0A934M4J9_9RHOB|nr:sulfotransferase [Pontibaca salina]MBI6630989.1 sulfotransferase domain-containing protein [Pontibaca salina]
MRAIIVIGPPRCGTTAFFRWLATHPEIAPSERKELNYFTGLSVTHDQFDLGQQAPYLAHIPPKAGARFSLEASPVYSHPQVMPIVSPRIELTLPDAKIIVMLRDPVDRFFSHYRVDQREGTAGAKTLSDYVRLSRGFDNRPAGREPLAENVWLQIADYPAILTQLLAQFPPRRIVPVFMDWFTTAPNYCADYLTEALGLYIPLEPGAIRAENTYYAPRNLSFHKLASAVRYLIEPTLQRFPGLRRKLYSAYRSVNISHSAGALGPVLEAEDIVELREFYCPRNEALRVLLGEYFKLEHIPDWLVE